MHLFLVIIIINNDKAGVLQKDFWWNSIRQKSIWRKCLRQKDIMKKGSRQKGIRKKVVRHKEVLDRSEVEVELFILYQLLSITTCVNCIRYIFFYAYFLSNAFILDVFMEQHHKFYLYPGLWEWSFVGQLLSCFQVWVVSLLKLLQFISNMKTIFEF